MKRSLRIIGINLLVLLGLLVVLEIGLRVSGMKPIYFLQKNGNPYPDHLHNICQALRQGKEVRDLQSFFTDSSGIFRATAGNDSGRGDSPRKTGVNSVGFRGNEFTFMETGKTKVYFIGDSFTWGSGADPIEESFPDLVARAGYHVYNGGIPGTDPQQYALLAEKYVPLLKPDVTVVCLYLGNDLKDHAIILLPNRNLHYVTRFGFVRGYDDNGRYFDNAQQAADYMKKQKCGCTDDWGEAFLYKTVVGKAVYRLFHMKNQLKSDPRRRWVVDCLERIRRVCRDSRSGFIIMLIPNKNPKKNRNSLKLVSSFPGIAYHYPEDFGIGDYRPAPDNHFNNQGHDKFARFIVKILKEEGFPPVF